VIPRVEQQHLGQRRGAPSLPRKQFRDKGDVRHNMLHKSTTRMERETAGAILGITPGATPESPGETLCRDQTLPDCVSHQPGRVVNLQLLHYASPMELGRLHTDSQLFPDFLVRPSFGHELDDLALTRGK